MTWTSLGVLVVAAAAVHTVALYFGIVSARCLRLGPASQIAIGIAGSQKTLMVGLQIAIHCGVSVIPMLVYHLGQFFNDTLLADRWKRTSYQESQEDATSLPSVPSTS